MVVREDQMKHFEPNIDGPKVEDKRVLAEKLRIFEIFKNFLWQEGMSQKILENLENPEFFG